MHSILDEVAQAEATAATIRLDANNAAREAAIKAQADVDARYAEQLEDGRDALRQAIQTAESDGRAQTERILNLRSAQADAQCKEAKAKLPDAVSYLLRRVVKQA